MQPRTGWPAKTSSMMSRRMVCVALAAAVTLVAMPRPAVAASPTKGAAYTHNSGDESHTDVQLQVGPGGKLIKRIFLLITLPCTNGRVGSALLRWPPRAERPARLPIARDGSFSGTLTGRQELLNPFLASEEYWLSGRFIRRGKAARLVVRARHVGEGGTVCDTGDRRVTARRVDAIAVRAGAS
jgi:hypothetical protein